MISRNENRSQVLISRFLGLGFAAHALALVCIGLFVYSNAIFHPFVHDDLVFILQNPNIARWDNIADAFLRPSIPVFFEGLVTPYYRPVLEVLYRLQYSLFGFDPHGFHLFNVVVHCANTLLVYGLLVFILKNRSLTFLAACVFLLHPVQTQAVSCVSGISNLACAFFLLVALNVYVRLLQSQENSSPFWSLMLVVGSFMLALLSKEQAMVLPMICLMFELLLNGRTHLSGRVWRLVALVIVLLLYLAVRSALFGSFASAIFENIAELKLRLLAVPGTLVMYMGLVFWPVGLHYYRSIDILAPFAGYWIMCALGLLVLWSLVKRMGEDKKRQAVFGLCWFLLALGPVLNIVPLVNEYSFLAAAEHNLYFPLIGFLIFSCAVISHCASIWPFTYRQQWIWFFVLLIIVLAGATVAQNRVWKSEISLFERALRYQPQLGRVRILLAKAYFQAGRLDEAIAQFDLAGETMSRYAKKAASPKARRFYDGMLKGIFSDSAQAFAFKRDFHSALDRYGKALALDPRDSFLYSNRALARVGMGDLDGGIKDLQQALSLDPNNLLAANNLSICFIQKGDTMSAKTLLNSILAKDPGFKAARDNLEQLSRQEMIKP